MDNTIFTKNQSSTDCASSQILSQSILKSNEVQNVEGLKNLDNQRKIFYQEKKFKGAQREFSFLGYRNFNILTCALDTLIISINTCKELNISFEEKINGNDSIETIIQETSEKLEVINKSNGKIYEEKSIYFSEKTLQYRNYIDAHMTKCISNT